jgi:DNA-binding NtrC family response regulator
VTSIQREAMEALVELPWRGNVRELRKVIEAAAALANHTITVKDIRDVMRRHAGFAPLREPEESHAERPAFPPVGCPEPHSCEAALFAESPYRELTARYFRFLYQTSGGRLSEVARRAGIGKATAYEWRDRFLSEGGGAKNGDPGS